MRRENFTVAVTAGDDVPVLTVGYEGSDDFFDERLAEVFGTDLDEEIDVAFRLQEGDEDGETGVLSVTTRVTGEYVVETNHPAEDLRALVDAARETSEGEDVRYRVEFDRDGRDPLVFEKRTLLVYDADGSLLRQQSLIPNGVEL